LLQIAGLALGLSAVLGACTVGSVGRAGDADTENRSQELAAQLQEQFGRLPGAADASVSYQDNITKRAALRANVRVEAGTDITATLDAVEEAVWLSEVDPLRDLHINVADQAEPPVVEIRDYDLADRAQGKSLTERWGERP
jgi:hypothetical protein